MLGVPTSAARGSARHRLAGAIAALLLALGAVSGGAAEELRVATYNAQSGEREVPTISALIARCAPHVAALQELSPEGARRLDEALASTFAYRAFPPASQGGGLGLVASVPIHHLRYRPSAAGGNGFMFAELDVDGRRVQVANLHLDPLKTWTWALRLSLPWQWLRHGSVHRSELEQVFGELRPDLPTLIVGDLNSYGSNAAPQTLVGRGFVDSYAAEAGAAADDTVTHRFSLAGAEFGGRIDFIFHSADLRTLDSRIVAGTPSDHDLLMSSLEWANR